MTDSTRRISLTHAAAALLSRLMTEASVHGRNNLPRSQLLSTLTEQLKLFGEGRDAILTKHTAPPAPTDPPVPAGHIKIVNTELFRKEMEDYTKGSRIIIDGTANDSVRRQLELAKEVITGDDCPATKGPESHHFLELHEALILV